jgi:hypothetical protein
MRKSYIIFPICLLIFFIFTGLNSSIIGVTANSLERDARKSQKIDENWQVSKSVTDNLGALLFYDKGLKKFTYSIYVNRKGLSFGYFFRSGGSTIDILEGIRAFDYGNSIALISINKVEVARIECISKNSQKQGEVYSVEPGKPFAIAIPITHSDMVIKIYDQNGNEIPITTISSCN